MPELDLFFFRWNKWLSKYQDDKNFCTFLNDDGKEISKYTYKSLNDRVTKLAISLLTTHKLVAGQRIMLVFEPSTDFIVAFLACLRARLIAVPVYPPNPLKMKKDMYQFISIQRSSGATVALTCKSYNFAKKVSSIKNIFSGVAKWPKLTWIVVDEKGYKDLDKVKLDTIPTENFPFPVTDDVAFLQYTSGSTSDPKGVTITHKNLSHNLFAIGEALVGSGPPPVVVSWLPQFHDMGLIGSWLGALYTGGCGVYMSPISFLRRPIMWLDAISKYGGTHSQVPNFALPLTLRKWKQKQKKEKNKGINNNVTLKLGTMRHLFNAAEPVVGKDIDNWNKTFSEFGFPSIAMVPGYGLAEHTVFVCEGGGRRINADAVALESNRIVDVNKNENIRFVEMMSCGLPGKNNDIVVKIVTEKKTENNQNSENLFEVLPENCIGEIWVRSMSNARGYWGLDSMSEETFNIRFHYEFHFFFIRNFVPNKIFFQKYFYTIYGVLQDNDAGYLRTGDLGFLNKGELFVCGRIKDLIIIRGRNHYPQDIEKLIENDKRIRPGCTASFTVTNKEMNLWMEVIAEIRDEYAKDQMYLSDIAKRIHSTTLSEQGLSIELIVLIKPRTISKTSSGKIQRNKCKKRLIGTKKPILSELFRWRPNTKANSVEDSKIESVEQLCPSQKSSIQAGRRYEEMKLNKNGQKLQNDLRLLVLDIVPEECNFETFEDVSTSESLQQIGFDSLLLEQFRGTIAEEYNIDVPVEIMYDTQTNIAMLVQLLLDPKLMSERLEEVVKNVDTKTQDSKDSSITRDKEVLGKAPKHKNPKQCCIIS